MPRRPRCPLIEEWWINVHAFDLAGGALSNRVPLSRDISRRSHLCLFHSSFFFFLSLYSVFCARVTATNAPRRKKRIHTVRLPTHFFLLPLSDAAWRVAIASFLFPKKYIISAPRYSS